MQKNDGKSYFARARVGLFTHYTYATYDESKGKNWGSTTYSQTDLRGAVSAEEAAALFDGDAVDLSGIHIFHHPLEARSLEVSPTPSVVNLFGNAGEAVFFSKGL